VKAAFSVNRKKGRNIVLGLTDFMQHWFMCDICIMKLRLDFIQEVLVIAQFRIFCVFVPYIKTFTQKYKPV